MCLHTRNMFHVFLGRRVGVEGSLFKFGTRELEGTSRRGLTLRMSESPSSHTPTLVPEWSCVGQCVVAFRTRSGVEVASVWSSRKWGVRSKVSVRRVPTKRRTESDVKKQKQKRSSVLLVGRFRAPGTGGWYRIWVRKDGETAVPMFVSPFVSSDPGLPPLSYI